MPFFRKGTLLRAGDWLWEKWRWGVLVKNNLPDGATCIKVISLSYFSELDGRVSFEEEFD